MLFNTIGYWLFFALVLLVFYRLPFRCGKVFLLLASYYFYQHWNPRLIFLILASTLVDYTLGRLLETPNRRLRKYLLVVSLIVNLGLLGFFKYYNFFAASFALLLGLPENSWQLRIILPIGISFYTFASLSYTIDVYRGKMRAVRNLIDYAFFVAFFPHLIAGPIIRARTFLAQIGSWSPPSSLTLQRGLILIVGGLVKKMVFADQFALTSDSYFDNLSAHPGPLAAWTGSLAFLMQVYFDFSGYTDIARGCAKLLGFEFPENFLRPYLARNAADFWQRWHITLSHWLRDYLFFPLVRVWKSRAAIYPAMFITMLLGGLWHGANWTFVLWGVYWGVRLIGFRIWERWSEGTKLERLLERRALAPLNVVTTFVFLPLGAVLFRSRDFAETGAILRQMFAFEGARGESMLTAGGLALILIAFVLAVLEERHAIFQRAAHAPPWIQITGYALAFLALELFSVTEQKIPFIYFQF